jgi:hypothetical protein
VQKKIQGFGSDVAKLALGVAGPMALLQAGIGYVTNKWNEYKQAQTDAFEKGAAGAYSEVKRQMDINEQLDKGLSFLLAQKKVKEELAKTSEQVKNSEKQAVEEFKKTAEGQAAFNRIYGRGSQFKTAQEREEALTSEAVAFGTRKQEEAKAEELKKLQGPLISDQDRKALEEIAKINEELAKRGGKSLFDITALDRFVKAFKDESANPKQKTKEETKKDLVLTVSSLREIGGSFGGGDVSTGIEKQIVLAEKQLDTLTEIKDALNRGSQESQVFPQGLRETMETTA